MKYTDWTKLNIQKTNAYGNRDLKNELIG